MAEYGHRGDDPGGEEAPKLAGNDWYSPRVYKKLLRAVDASHNRLQPQRKSRVAMIEAYVGGHYSEAGSRDRVPVNFMELFLNTYMTQLASAQPQVLVGTAHPELKAASANLELAVNHLLKEIEFGQTLQEVVLDGLLGMGILKVGLQSKGPVEVDGVFFDPGQPYCERVDFDSWVHDIGARSVGDCTYMGNRYSLPLEFLKDSEMYDQKVVKKLIPGEMRDYQPNSGEKKVETIGRGHKDSQDERWMEHVELWDLWLPMHGVVLTCPVDHNDGERQVLRVVEWDGPERGPYHLLRFNPVPEAVLPLAPASVVFDLHDASNKVFRKLLRQVERQKTLATYVGTSEKDMERVKKANDGDIVRVDHQHLIKEIKTGGADRENFAFFSIFRDYFSYLGGGLDVLGGLAAQSETLGQDKLLHENASQRVRSMQDVVVRYTRNVVNDLAWYLWTDPWIELPMTKRLPGTDYAIPVTFNEESKEGDFLDYNFDIEPFSLRQQTPSDKVNTILNMVVPFIGNMMPLIQQEGGAPNVQLILSDLAKYLNMPGIRDYVQFQEPLFDVPGPVGKPPAKMGGGGGEYIHKNVSTGGTQGGRDKVLQASLLGSDVQPAEKGGM